MSSKIEVQRICEYCGNDFIAKTTVTRFCTDGCAKKAYKARIKEEKIKRSNKETFKIKIKPIEELQMKEILNVQDIALLLGCSKRSAYRLINTGMIKAVNLGERLTRIKRSELDRILEQNNEITPMKKDNFNISECYNIKEVQEKFNISESALRQIILRNHIPKFKNGIYSYVPKDRINSLLQ